MFEGIKRTNLLQDENQIIKYEKCRILKKENLLSLLRIIKQITEKGRNLTS